VRRRSGARRARSRPSPRPSFPRWRRVRSSWNASSPGPARAASLPTRSSRATSRSSPAHARDRPSRRGRRTGADLLSAFIDRGRARSVHAAHRSGGPLTRAPGPRSASSSSSRSPCSRRSLPGPALGSWTPAAARSCRTDPHDPDAVNLDERFESPGAPWLGTDELGRDVLARLVHGARVSVGAGLLACGVALLFGATLGATAGSSAAGRAGDPLRRRNRPGVPGARPRRRAAASCLRPSSSRASDRSRMDRRGSARPRRGRRLRTARSSRPPRLGRAAITAAPRPRPRTRFPRAGDGAVRPRRGRPDGVGAVVLVRHPPRRRPGPGSGRRARSPHHGALVRRAAGPRPSAPRPLGTAARRCAPAAPGLECRSREAVRDLSGSFDPITNGHVDLIRRGCHIFDACSWRSSTTREARSSTWGSDRHGPGRLPRSRGGREGVLRPARRLRQEEGAHVVVRDSGSCRTSSTSSRWR